MHSARVTRDEDGKRKVTSRYLKDSFLEVVVLIFEPADSNIGGTRWSE